MLIIKNIYHKIKIHFLFWLVAFLCFLTGRFKDFFYITILIIIHELGHILASIIYKWKIDKIIILPIGGIIFFKEILNKSLISEFVILIMGPLFQILFGFIISNYVSDSVTFIKYNYSILFFNLLPIIPLDGSKLINIVLNKISPFKKSHIFTIYISLIVIVFLLLISHTNLLLLLILFFLLLKICNEYKCHNYIVNKFLFERYLYKIKFKKTKVINNNNIYSIYKDYNHIFFDQNKYVTERELLKKKFDNTNNLW